MLTFQDALHDADRTVGNPPGKILLLGNGFSSACAIANSQMTDDNFNYSKLLDVIEKPLPNSKNIRELF